MIAPSIAQASPAAWGAGQARQIRLASSIWRGAALSCRPGRRGLLRCHSTRFEVLDFKQPLEKLSSEYFRTNIAITTTGVFSHAALIAAIPEVGVDNVMFSIDYPFESTEKRFSSSEPRRRLLLTRREWRT